MGSALLSATAVATADAGDTDTGQQANTATAGSSTAAGPRRGSVRAGTAGPSAPAAPRRATGEPAASTRQKIPVPAPVAASEAPVPQVELPVAKAATRLTVVSTLRRGVV